MRTTLALILGALLSAGVARTAWGQLPAGAKIQGIYSKDDQQRKAREAEQIAARDQAAAQQAQPYRVEMWVPEPMPGNVQPAGYGVPATGDVQQAGFHHHHQGYGAYCNPHMMGGYGGHGHHGMHYGGGYGYFGGAHHTPGYPHFHHYNREYVGPQGPPTAAVAYPYYTLRGPRDFLIDNPPSIGR